MSEAYLWFAMLETSCLITAVWFPGKNYRLWKIKLKFKVIIMLQFYVMASGLISAYFTNSNVLLLHYYI